MTRALDLRTHPDETHQELLFDALDDAEAGTEIALTADRQVNTLLIQYQNDRGRSLTWEHDEPDGDPRRLQMTKEGPLDGEMGSFDVRDLIPQRRHEALLETFETLEAGEGFVLVNDHDPKPLYHELRSMHGDSLDWEYEQEGRSEWRVRIEKTAASDASERDVVTTYDVREIPKAERHPTIHHRYGMIPEGRTLELVAPHEPRPLRQEFQRQYGDSFDWEIVEQSPGYCRVHVTKRAEVGEGSEAVSGESAAGGCEHGANAHGADTDEIEQTAATDSETKQTAANESETNTDDSIAITEELDVRDLPPAKRHELIFESYAELDGGEGFVLVNDHDPKPLYHQFDAEAGPQFRWEYRQRDDGEFRVLIGKSGTVEGEVSDEELEAPF
ncbi:DUF2249 domain-containing protein [Halovenus marina]|uniref:DUF2249 domain-containing protein n=1 Tax=Halovenus marina TaxID=3396621 RepID=UPI003F578E03